MGVAYSLDMPSSGGRSSRRSRKKRSDMGGQKRSLLGCFGAPPVTNEEPLMSVEQFRWMHRRRQKGNQIQVLRPVHWLHPRAVMLTVLYESLTSDPHIRNNIPRRLRGLLEFHRTMICYDEAVVAEADEEGDIFHGAQEEPEEAEVGQTSSEVEAEAECSSAEVTQLHMRISSSGTAACRRSGSLDEIDDCMTAEAELPAQQAPAAKAQQAPQYQEEQVAAGADKQAQEGALLEEEQDGFASPRAPTADDDDSSSCDEAAYAAMLGSPVRSVQRQDMKRAASPVRHGYSQPIIKINASAGTCQPAPMELHIPASGDGGARRRFVYDGLRWSSLADAKAARKATSAPSPLAPSVAANGAAQEPATNKHDDKEPIASLLDTMSSGTGERTAEAAQARLVALDAMIGGAQAQLARLAARPSRKVSALVKTFHELEESASAASSPRITAPRKTPPLNLHNNKVPQQDPGASANNSPIKPVRQEAPCAAATTGPAVPVLAMPAQQKAVPFQAEPPCTPPRAPAASAEGPQCFSTPSGHLFNAEKAANPLFADEAAAERLLWSPDFLSDFDGQPNPELAARHAAAAARHAAAAARHAAAAAKYAGLRVRAANEALLNPPNRRRPHAGHAKPQAKPQDGLLDTQTTMAPEDQYPESMMATVNNLLYEP